MHKSSLALLFSIISLVISFLYYLSFHAFRKSNIFRYDNEYVYLKYKKALFCEDVNDRTTCNTAIVNSKVLNSDKNNLYFNKNALVCKDIDDKKTCTCLFKDCRKLNDKAHFTFINEPIAFTENTDGLYFGGRVIPTLTKDQFTFSTWINITNINVDKWRSILHWEDDDNTKQPSILISPEKWSDCGAKIDIRFTNVEGGEGEFNVINNNHRHCVKTTPHYKWFHFALTAKENILKIYINGKFVDEQKLKKSIKIGSQYKPLYIGGGNNLNANGIILAKTRWFAESLDSKYIDFLFYEKPTE
jgi:hypothetical protein